MQRGIDIGVTALGLRQLKCTDIRAIAAGSVCNGRIVTGPGESALVCG
jgi:hypothetical protein